jgi:glycosyltransferase involved in cell wall biosynthesis
MPGTLAWRGLPELTWDLVENHYLPLIASRRTRSMPEFDHSERRPHLLIVSHDVVDVKMAGPGMRYLEMARALSGEIDVTLAVPSETSLDVPGLRLVRYWEDRPGSLQVLVENSDIVLVSGYMVEKFPFLAHTRARLVVDLYDPFVLENLHYYLQEPVEVQEQLNDHAVAITNHLAKIGDFFICGNDRQRDYWMGVLTANGRANPRNFLQDPTLYQLIDIVGIGFPSREPQGKPMFRGVHPQLPPEARIVLWGGGIWNWLDPLTLIQAWPEVLARHPDARLVFLGTRHPNPLVPRHEMAEKAERLAAEIGEKDRSILFFEWLSYEDREALLCEAEVGVTMHPVHVETRYSLRTRVLDYLWARLPVLITDGDVTSEWVREYGIGAVVPPFDAGAVAAGLAEILDRPKSAWAPAFEPLRASLEWTQVVQPLLRYCLEGERAPDRLERDVPASQPSPGSTAGRLARARVIWRTEGTRMLLHRVWRHLQWRLSRL